MPNCTDDTNEVLEKPIDCFDDVATAIEQTRLVFSELLGDVQDTRTHLRTLLAFRIKGDDGEIIEPDAWPAMRDSKRAALIAMLGHIEESVAIAEGVLGPPVDRLKDRVCAARTPGPRIAAATRRRSMAGELREALITYCAESFIASVRLRAMATRLREEAGRLRQPLPQPFPPLPRELWRRARAATGNGVRYRVQYVD